MGKVEDNARLKTNYWWRWEKKEVEVGPVLT